MYYRVRRTVPGAPNIGTGKQCLYKWVCTHCKWYYCRWRYSNRQPYFGLGYRRQCGNYLILHRVSSNYLKTFTINSGGGAALGNALNIAAGTYASSGVLTTNGSLNTNDFLTLNRMLSVMCGRSSTGTITGGNYVERYIPATRAWRFLSVSATNQSINQAWQESQTNTSVSCSYVDPTPAGLGTQLTGIGGAGSGFDF